MTTMTTRTPRKKRTTVKKSNGGVSKSPIQRIKILVDFKLPEGAKPEDAVAYVEEAVKSWSGSLQPPGMGGGGPDPNEPGDPMYNLDSSTVSARFWG